MGYWLLRPTVKLFVILRFTQNDTKWLAEDGKILKVNFFTTCGEICQFLLLKAVLFGRFTANG